MASAACDHLYIYLDISGTMTSSGNYAAAVKQIETLLKKDFPKGWPCVDIHIRFFAARVLDESGDNPLLLKGYESGRDGTQLSQFLAQPLEAPYSKDLVSKTNITAVFDSISIEADSRQPGRRMFLIFSDLAHDVGSIGRADDEVVEDRISATKIFEEIAANKSVWDNFKEPAVRTFLGVILPVKNRLDQARQNAVRHILQGIPGITLLYAPSSGELFTSMIEGLAPLVLEATRKRTSTFAGWNLKINNLWSVEVEDVEFNLLCDTDNEPKKKSQGNRTDPIKSGESEIDLSEADLNAPAEGTELRRCTLYVSGKAKGSGGDKSILGSVRLYQGVFIELDLDYVRPELDFVPEKGSVTVIFKLRGQLEGDDPKCESVEVALSARRGDATIPVATPSALGGAGIIEMTSALSSVRDLCIHPMQWRAFKVKLPLEANARDIPLCAHESPMLVFRVTAKPSGRSEVDEEMWRHRREEANIPKHDDGLQGHEAMKEFIIPITASAVGMFFVLLFHRGLFRLDRLINMIAIVGVAVMGVYGMLHEFTGFGRRWESWLYTDPRIPLWLIGCSVFLFVWMCMRRGVFTGEVEPAIGEKRVLHEPAAADWFWRRMGQVAVLALAVTIGLIIWYGLQGDEIEKICAYQNVFIPRQGLEGMLELAPWKTP